VADVHAQRMDRMYRHQRHLYDATRKWYLFGRDTLIAGLDPPSGAHVCEVGCGTARNLVQIARRYPWTRLYGLDASGEMLKSAADKVARAGLEARIALRAGLAERLDPAATFGVAQGFDVVVLSYVLSMVPDWPAALAASVRALRPGGALELVDFGPIERLPWPLAEGLRAWLKRFGVTPRPQIAERLRALAAEGAGHAEVATILGGYAILGRFVRAA